MTRKAQTHDDVLERIAHDLDIPDSKYEEAVARYKAVGDWLEREQSDLSQYRPEISPQGSFLLGTVIKPLSDGDEYDIDLVCSLNATKNDFTQKSLKEAVGSELVAYTNAQRMKNAPDEKQRCWRLKYAGDSQFHMDIVPALPDAKTYQAMLRSYGYPDLSVNPVLTGEAIAITDSQLPNYEQLTNDWPVSNPKGYAAWFRDQMRVQLEALRQALAEQNLMASAKVEDVPDYKVKTPLQRAVQLLKRHRDIMFGDNEDKPISIIITTLAAHAYNNESTISMALKSILTGMENYIECRGKEYWIVNPVNPAENFADKWAGHPKKKEIFDQWLSKANQDFALYILSAEFYFIPEELQNGLGREFIKNIIDDFLPEKPNRVLESVRDERAQNEVKNVNIVTQPWAESLK